MLSLQRRSALRRRAQAPGCRDWSAIAFHCTSSGRSCRFALAMERPTLEPNPEDPTASGEVPTDRIVPRRCSSACDAMQDRVSGVSEGERQRQGHRNRNTQHGEHGYHRPRAPLGEVPGAVDCRVGEHPGRNQQEEHSRRCLASSLCERSAEPSTTQISHRVCSVGLHARRRRRTQGPTLRKP